MKECFANEERVNLCFTRNKKKAHPWDVHNFIILSRKNKFLYGINATTFKFMICFALTNHLISEVTLIKVVFENVESNFENIAN